VAEPTLAETQRLMHRMNGCGTVRRLDVLYEALVTAYRVGAADELHRQRHETECESCLEG
jgi:hypothetical protein